MHIVVCIKQIFDPETPQSQFKVDPVRKVAVDQDATLVISTFDECAIEVGLQLRDEAGGGTVTVISLGSSGVEDALRQALAMRCDRAVRIDVEDPEHLDTIQVANLLANAIRSLGAVDLVLFGREAGDWGCGQVGTMTAELLALPVLSNVSKVKKKGEIFDAKRFGTKGWEGFEVGTPAILTVTNSQENVPRYPAVRDKLQARRKLIEILNGKALVSDQFQLPVTVEQLIVPKNTNQCLIIHGESPSEKVDELVQVLKEWKVITN